MDGDAAAPAAGDDDGDCGVAVDVGDGGGAVDDGAAADIHRGP